MGTELAQKWPEVPDASGDAAAGDIARRVERHGMPDETGDWPPPEPEIEILRLHMQGLSDEAIARRLGVSETTVRRRAARTRQRCRARTRAEAIAVLVSEGLLTIPPRGGDH
jgi:DNA-binding NarL/FixJ family response regulator